ncbi:MAG: porin family protein [Pseudolabrys sp.]|nr:porin family protein [Pseudolabrys sp.]
MISRFKNGPRTNIQPGPLFRGQTSCRILDRADCGAGGGFVLTQLQGAGLFRAFLFKLERLLSRSQRWLRIRQIELGCTGSQPEPKGGLFGVTAGYNFQTGIWLWGAEGDFDISTMKGSATCSGTATCDTKNSWLSTVRGRFGYAGWNNWLPYITGGLAMGDIKATNSVLSSANKTKMGYALGAGVEYAMMTNWSVKLEYLYVDLGKFDCGVACSATKPDNVSFNANVVRAGLNYRF